ncbi:hypothetical protein NJ7G_1679 [Natrinema sp. J7-2]|nr:hypothetical protein NJ7G_1679 [Natrinema sp. J7-2]
MCQAATIIVVSLSSVSAPGRGRSIEMERPQRTALESAQRNSR